MHVRVPENKEEKLKCLLNMKANMMLFQECHEIKVECFVLTRRVLKLNIECLLKRKQVMSLQLTMENPNGWTENHLSEQLKVYQEQQQQLHKGNQPPAVQKHHYHGQSLWEGFL